MCLVGTITHLQLACSKLQVKLHLKDMAITFVIYLLIFLKSNDITEHNPYLRRVPNPIKLSWLFYLISK